MRVSLAFLVLTWLVLFSQAQDTAPPSDEGVIAGRLVRETGEPGVGIGVRVRKVEYRAGRRTLIEPQRQNGETPRQVITDDRGNFRLFGLEAGEYYLTAAPVIPIRISLDPSQPLVRLDAPQANRDLLRTMHYPGVTSLHQAQSIPVRPGEEVRLLDFRFRTSVSGARITGKAISDVPVAAQEPPRSLLPPRQFESPEDYERYMAGYAAAARRTANEVILIPYDRNLLMEGNPFALQFYSFPFQDPDPNAFAVNNVPPGPYDLILVDRVRKLQSEPVPLVVGRSDIGGVQAVMHKASIRGRVSVSGNSETVTSALRGVELQPVHRAYALPEQLVDSAGDFAFPEISSGLYELGLVGLPDDACVVGLRYGEKTLDMPEIFIEEGPQSIEVLVNSSCGIVEGDVKGFSVAAAPAPRVVLVPEGPWRDFAVFYKDAAPDASGHFVLRGIPPGTYKLFAWASVPESAYMNAEYLSRYESLGQTVEVPPAATRGIELQLITP